MAGTEFLPDRDITALDIAAMIDATSGLGYPGPTPCTQRESDMPFAQADDLPTEMGMITLEADQTSVLRGELVTIHVYMSGGADLRGYQVQLGVSGINRKRLRDESLFIDTDHPDYAFAGRASYVATNDSSRRIAAVLEEGGVINVERVYLGTYQFRAWPQSTMATVQVSVPPGDGSFFIDSWNRAMGLEVGASVEVTVETGLSPAKKRRKAGR